MDTVESYIEFSIMYFQRASQSPWTVNSISSKGATYRATAINGATVISEMEKWVKEGGRYWGNPDHAMLWTKYVTPFLFTRVVITMSVI